MKEAFSLDQLLADPLIRMVMASDAVEEGEIRRLAARLVPKGLVRHLSYDHSRQQADTSALRDLAMAQATTVFPPVACFA